MSQRPETRYAETEVGRIAYQVIGEGPVDVLAVAGYWLPVDLMWDEPSLRRFLERMSRFCRHVWFDFRGCGASGPVTETDGRLAETAAADMLALVDHLGWERTAVLTFSAGGVGPLLFSAAHPERVRALVMLNPSAGTLADVDYQGFFSEEEASAWLDQRLRDWGAGAMLRYSHKDADDPDLAAWVAQCERLSVTPEDSVWRARSVLDMDVRILLPSVPAPTLVLSRWSNSRAFALSRYVAEHIPGAKFTELPDPDHLFFRGEVGPMLDAIEEFLTGKLPPPEVNRVLATVMFTDVVGPPSTPLASVIAAGGRCWPPMMTSFVMRCSVFEARRSKPLATASWSPLTGPVAPFNVPAPFGARSDRWQQMCGSAFILAR